MNQKQAQYMSEDYKEVNLTPEPLWDPEKVSIYFSVTTVTVYNWIKAGRIKAIKIGNRIRIPVSEITRLANETKAQLKP